MRKPVLYMKDIFDFMDNKECIAGQMFYEFNEIDFYVVGGWFLSYRKLHVTGRIVIKQRSNKWKTIKKKSRN
jgi:hypothetical protein